MPRFTPLVRVLLTGLAAGIAVLAASSDSLPVWAQAAIAGASTILAGLGIVPPTVPTQTVVAEPRPRRRRSTHGGD